jgi:hypothetical protein
MYAQYLMATQACEMGWFLTTYCMPAMLLNCWRPDRSVCFIMIPFMFFIASVFWVIVMAILVCLIEPYERTLTLQWRQARRVFAQWMSGLSAHEYRMREAATTEYLHTQRMSHLRWKANNGIRNL